MITRTTVLAWCVVIVLSMGAGAAWSQQTAPPAANGEEPVLNGESWPTLDIVRAYIERVDAQADLDQAAKDNLKSIYQAAIADLEAASQSRTQAQAFDTERTAAPQRLAELRTELQAIATDPPPIDTTGDLSDLENTLANLRQEFERWRNERDSLATESARRSDRLSSLPSLIAAKRDELRSLETPDQTTAPEGDAMTPEFARRVSATAKRRRLAAELRLLEAEQSSYSARAENLTARRERADRMATQLSKSIDSLQQVVTNRRTSAARAQAQESRTQAEALPNALAEAARQNASYAEELAVVQRNIGQRAQRLQSALDQFGSAKARLAQVREPGANAGRDRWYGVQLRSELSRLPNPRQLQATLQQLRDEIRSIRRRQFELNDALFSVSGDVSARVNELISKIDPTIAEDYRDEAGEIAQQQVSTLRALDSAFNEYLTTTIESAGAVQQTLTEVREFNSFIERQILWVRSDDALNAASTQRAISAFQTVLSPSRWLVAPQHILDEWKKNWARHLPLFLVAAGFIGLAPRMRRIARDIESKKASTVRQHMLRTTLAIGAILMGSAALPALLVAFGEFFLSFDGAWELAAPVAHVCFVLAVLFFATRFISSMCRPGGIGDRELRWPDAARRHVIRVIRLWTPLAAVALTGRYFFNAADDIPGSTDVARIFVILWMLLLVWLGWRFLRPKSPLMQHAFSKNQDGWLFKLWPFMVAALLAGPLLLAIGAGFGYTYTASQLSRRISATVLAIFVMIIVRSLLRRWLALQQRQIAIEQLREEQRRAAAEALSSKDETGIQVDSGSIDLSVISDQTNRLLRAGGILTAIIVFGLIWAELLPALQVLSEFQLPPLNVSVDDVLGAIIVIALTIVLARNVPGMLEVTVLRRLPLDAGGRYAVNSLLRYTMVVIGMIAAGAALGLKWSSVQWLAAAATVGLGFGLQEIFANFVSGLIILFERPVRVGDTVTVGALSGTVTKIRIRATTILDWDRKEIIIPNKEFITSQLINWSLTDSILRAIITVGVAYGSDTELVERLLLKVARENPNVLNDPAPYVYFKDFGDSALTFDLRLFLPNIDNMLSTQHQIRNAIAREFNEHNVEISFPQRDLHIRTIPAALAQTMGQRSPDKASAE